MTSGGTVKNDSARAERLGNDVRLEARSVVDIRYEDFLVGIEPDRLHQLDVNAEATLVVKVRLCHAGEMEFRLEHLDVHVIDPRVFLSRPVEPLACHKITRRSTTYRIVAQVF